MKEHYPWPLDERVRGILTYSYPKNLNLLAKNKFLQETDLQFQGGAVLCISLITRGFGVFCLFVIARGFRLIAIYKIDTTQIRLLGN